MLLRKALRSKAERNALADLNETLDSEVPGVAKKLASFFRLQSESINRDDLLTVLNTGVVPSSLRNKLYGAYSDFWQDHLWEWVGDVGIAGEAYTGLDLKESAFAGYLDERGKEWASLMTTGQFAAYREVRNICQEASLGVPQDDALNLMVLATGLSPQDASVLARRQVALIKEVRKALGSSLVRQAATLLQSRAMRTAEYELARAYNEAKRRAWALAERIGLVQQPTKTWVTAEEPGPDSRVCPLCTKLNGKSVAVNKEFEAGISGPPRHIRCRCSLTMSEKG